MSNTQRALVRLHVPKKCNGCEAEGRESQVYEFVPADAQYLDEMYHWNCPVEGCGCTLTFWPANPRYNQEK